MHSKASTHTPVRPLFQRQADSQAPPNIVGNNPSITLFLRQQQERAHETEHNEHMSDHSE
jgi:hypothetical protein